VLTGPYIERNSWGGIGLCFRKQDTRRNNLEHSLISPTVDLRLKIDTTIIAHASRPRRPYCQNKIAPQYRDDGSSYHRLGDARQDHVQNCAE
jgi:hypothetical protein